jgi:Anti-sigma-K factor rskA/Putative zinc-finger
MNGQGHLADLLGAYALDALDEDEAARVRAHLAQCPTCRAQFAGLAEAAARLADLYPTAPPSPELRGRVLAAIESAASDEAAVTQSTVAQSTVARPASPSARVSARPLLSRWVRPAQAIAALALVVSQVWLFFTVIALRAQVQQQAEAQTILLSSSETPVKLQAADSTSTALGVYHYEPDIRRGLINYYRLAPTGHAQSYQCWMEFAGGVLLACGRLPIDEGGSGMLVFTWPNSVPIRIRVTLEAGSPNAPAGPTILLGAIQPLQP